MPSKILKNKFYRLQGKIPFNVHGTFNFCLRKKKNSN